MSQKELAVLASLLARLKTTPKKKGAKASPAGQSSTPGTSGMPVSQSTGKRRRRRRGVGGGEGTVTISRRELFCSLTTSGSSPATSGVLPLKPKAGGPLAWLYNLGQAFEQIVWHSAKLEWVPMVGTTEGGAVIYGVDWANAVSATDLTRARVAALTPVTDTPVWQRSSMVLPSSQLQSRRFYSLVSTDAYDSQPGQVAWCASSKSAAVVGELWLTYRVTLKGTRPV